MADAALSSQPAASSAKSGDNSVSIWLCRSLFVSQTVNITDVLPASTWTLSCSH